MTVLPITGFTEDTTIRLIATAYLTEPALAPLADDPSDLDVLERLEMMTSARHLPRLPMPGGIDPAELLTEADGFGWTYVNAAFCYTRLGGSRFNAEDRGAWYATTGPDAAETAQAEIAWHLSRELAATGIFENTTRYRELLAGFSTRLHDLRRQPAHAALDADPAKGYPEGQALARAVFAEGGNGILYPSVRKNGGQCLAAFRPRLVQNIRLGRTWRFTWSGSVQPAITEDRQGE